MLSVIMVSVFILNVVAPFCWMGGIKKERERMGER